MSKLILKQSKLQAVNDSEEINLSELRFDLNQFNIPKSMLFMNDGLTGRVEKIKNDLGELVETGFVNLTFKIFDRPFIEMVLGNGGTEIGSPISIQVDKQNSLPDLSMYQEGEFIPITFKNIHITPKKIKKGVFVGAGKGMVDSWQYDAVKISADSFVLGEENAK